MPQTADQTQAKKDAGTKRKAALKKKKTSAGAKVPSWTFPKNTLEDAIRVPQAIEQQNAGNPMKSEELVKAVGFNSTSDWRYLDLLRSANLYGLV
jgi:hypothetical protein